MIDDFKPFRRRPASRARIRPISKSYTKTTTGELHNTPPVVHENTSEQVVAQTPSTSIKPTIHPTKSKSRFVVLMQKFFKKPKGKKQWAIAAGIVTLLFGGTATALVMTRQKPLPPPPVVQKEEPAVVVEPVQLRVS